MDILVKSLENRGILVKLHYIRFFITPGCGLHIRFFISSNKSSIVELQYGGRGTLLCYKKKLSANQA